MQTLISSSDSWSLWAALAIAAWGDLRLERTRLGSRISGAVSTMLITFALSNARIIPADAPTYGMVWSFLVPLAIPLLLLRAVIASNANMGGPTTAAAMAAGRRWHGLVVPAILCGTLGYATATFVGVAVGHALASAAASPRTGPVLSRKDLQGPRTGPPEGAADGGLPRSHGPALTIATCTPSVSPVALMSRPVDNGCQFGT